MAASCGLMINKDKSNIMIYNSTEPHPDTIEDIKIVDNIKYLGVKITNK